VPDVRIEALTLSGAERLLVERNRELQAARRMVDLARADTLVAGAAPNPQVTLGGGVINPQNGLGRAAYPGSLRVEQLIERGNKRELRIETARRLQAAAGEDFSEVLRTQRLAAAYAYFDLELAQDRTAVTAENVALYQRTLEAADRRLRAGDIAMADVARIRVDVLRAQNDALQADADRRRAQVALGYLLGVEPEARAIHAVDAWPPYAEGLTERYDDADLDRRPDVRAAKAREEAAVVARDLARALRTRDVSVGAGIDRFPPAETNTLGSGTAVGVSVSFPLFLRYHYEGEIARAETDYSAAVEALDRVRAQARAELDRALAELQAAAGRLRRFDQTLLVEAQKSAQFAEFAYRNGAIGVMDLLDARRTLRAIQLDAAQARADYAKALATWRAGLGEPLQ